jgi:hypothetical protein
VTTRYIVALLHEGDWACAYGDRGRFANVCRRLARVVEPEISGSLRRAASTAESDRRESLRLWTQAAVRLRGSPARHAEV